MDPKTNELTLNLGPMSPNYKCVGKRMHSATLWMGIVGFAVMTILMAKKVKGAIMLGIVFVTVVSWIPGHLASYLGEGSDIDGTPGGAWDYSGIWAGGNGGGLRGGLTRGLGQDLG
jgi:AGZA family xanthine/uracil permease-like MFS transporter